MNLIVCICTYYFLVESIFQQTGQQSWQRQKRWVCNFLARYISREYLKMAVLFMWLQFHISIDIMVLGFVIWLKTKAACGELPELPELKLWLPLSPSSAGGHTSPSPSHQHDHKLLDFISKCFPAVCSGWGAEQRKYFITFKLGQRIWAKFPVFCR